MTETLDHIERLERSNRFWRTTTFCLAALVLILLTVGTTAVALTLQRSALAMEAAMQARDEAELARARAEQAKEQARPMGGP